MSKDRATAKAEWYQANKGRLKAKRQARSPHRRQGLSEVILFDLPESSWMGIPGGWRVAPSEWDEMMIEVYCNDEDE